MEKAGVPYRLLLMESAWRTHVLPGALFGSCRKRKVLGHWLQGSNFNVLYLLRPGSENSLICSSMPHKHNAGPPPSHRQDESFKSDELGSYEAGFRRRGV